MPNNFYCFTKMFGSVPVEFIALDTNLDVMKNRVSQEKWAVNTLLESRARWRIIFGHHPWKSFGKDNEEKHAGGKLDEFYQNLVDTQKVDLIISGHDNSQQHIYIPDKPDMVISGVGGYAHTEESKRKQRKKELKFRSLELGCVKIDVLRDELTVNFYNTNQTQIYSFKIKKV